MIPAGILFAVVGLVLLGIALRGDRNRPRTVAMLIAGMMATAFGLLMAGFAVAYDRSIPSDRSAPEIR